MVTYMVPIMAISPRDNLKHRVIAMENWHSKEDVGSEERERSATDMIFKRSENPAQSP